MNTTVNLSLPPDQLELIQKSVRLQEKLILLQNRAAWLSEKEAAERLKVSLSTLQRWRREGWLRHYRDGEKVILYRTDQLDADIEKKLGVTAYR